MLVTVRLDKVLLSYRHANGFVKKICLICECIFKAFSHHHYRYLSYCLRFIRYLWFVLFQKVLEKQLPRCPMPMPRVGEFLKSLLNDVELTTFCTPKRYLKGAVPHTPTSIPSWSTVHQFVVSVELHYTPGFDKTQLLSIIFGIYCGVPESFEFFRCSSDTTELDLKRFVERIWKHARTYMMFGVNNLSLHLQEVSFECFKWMTMHASLLVSS